MLDAHGIVETYFFKLLAQQKARSFSCKSIEANDASDRARSRAYVQSIRPTGGFRMIYFLASIAAIAGFLFGYDEGVIAVARPLLEKDFPMTPLVGGFVTAAVPLGALIGASLAGRITDRYGRRRVLMAAAALFAVGALIAAGMTATWILVAARLVLGLAIGVAAVTAPLYIAEAAPVSIRGGLVATYQLAITFGILVSYLTGLAIEGDGTWRLMFGLGAVPGLLFLLGLAFLPESPRWLMLKRFPDQARASLLRLRGEGANVSQ